MRKYVTQAEVRESIERLVDITQAVEHESFERLGDAARNNDEFNELVKKMDELDEKVQDAYGKTVWSTDNEKFNWDAYSAKAPDTSRDILQILFCCICQMHHLIEDKDISLLIEKATNKQKEVFFLRYIRYCSPQTIAELLNVTDRNVRDLIDKMLTKIQDGLYDALMNRRGNNIHLTKREAAFLNTYKPKRGVSWTCQNRLRLIYLPDFYRM